MKLNKLKTSVTRVFFWLVCVSLITPTLILFCIARIYGDAKKRKEAGQIR
jgi:hypothetical protein